MDKLITLYHTNKQVFCNELTKEFSQLTDLTQMNIYLDDLTKNIYYNMFNYNHAGYIYAIRHNSFAKDIHKLGYTKNMASRVSGYKTGMPDGQIQIVSQSKVLNNRLLAEKIYFYLLRQYATGRGEFFQCSKATIDEAIMKVETMFLTRKAIVIVPKIYDNIKTDIRKQLKALNSPQLKSIIQNSNVYDYKIKPEELVNIQNITDEKAMILEQKKIKNEISNSELLELEKYTFMKFFHFDENTNLERLKCFLAEEIKNQYSKKLDRLIDFLKNIYDLNKKEFEKEKSILDLTILCGFSGLFDKRQLQYITTERVKGFTDEMKNRIRSLFSRDDDCGRMRAVNSRLKVCQLLNRILFNQYGISIMKINTIRRRANKRIIRESKFSIQFTPIILDYLIIKSITDLDLFDNIDDHILDEQFTRTDIHGHQGSYREYINSLNIVKRHKINSDNDNQLSLYKPINIDLKTDLNINFDFDFNTFQYMDNINSSNKDNINSKNTNYIKLDEKTVRKIQMLESMDISIKKEIEMYVDQLYNDRYIKAKNDLAKAQQIIRQMSTLH